VVAVADPGEHVNLWATSGHQDRKKELLGVMRDWMMRSSLKTAPWRSPLR